MAFIATVRILVDDDSESLVHDGLNEMLMEQQMGCPNGEKRGWIVDWAIGPVSPANEVIREAIRNGRYQKDAAFGFLSLKPYGFSEDHTKACLSEGIPVWRLR
ncbi:hypothetical protein [Pelomicrobium methylotrophicum]|uniref:Uncharacterized protein n=1 Tax=Pelomicrobium methylotrophicum TaxID=2602750 RepID=A0A5C7ESH4_9PROT|nr:hypothetical protein [Pelomicrobium methylotrophicum]TXF11617.1 hypothetical protein FR698_09770 [Pelomicrobium methylotrophicum]